MLGTVIYISSKGQKIVCCLAQLRINTYKAHRWTRDQQGLHMTLPVQEAIEQTQHKLLTAVNK